MNCPKCSSPVSDEALFCQKCGASVASEVYTAEEMEKTMAIPTVRTTEMGESLNVRRETQISIPKTEQTVSKSKQGIGRWQTFVIAFLVTVIVCLSLALALALLQRETLPKMEENQEIIVDTKDKTKEEKTEEEEEELSDGESVGVEDEVCGIHIDTAYQFRKGVSLKSPALSYKTMSGADYRCDVPSEFEFVYERDGEIRYCAQDKTAYMDIGSFENKSSLSINQIKDKAAKDIGGKQVSSEIGEGVYSLTVDRDDIRYYHKCISSGDNVIYFELVYPAEYEEVYGVYASDIDKSFEIVS